MTKKRITKRIMAIVVATLMLVAMAIPAIAAPSQPNSGSITVHKYSGAGYGYRSDNEFSGDIIPDGDPAHPAENDYIKLPGVGFSLYSLNMTDVNARVADGDIVTGYTADEEEVTFTFATGSPTTITVTGTIVGSEKTTDGDGKIEFTDSPGLADGYYVLVETSPLADYDPAAPSVIRLPLTSADGQSLNYDVHVYPKNISTKDIVVKQLGNGGAKPISNGDIIPFELLAKFKNEETSTDKVNSVEDLRAGTGPYTYGKAQIIDSLHADLEYQEDVEVYWMANDGTLSATALLSTEYEATVTGNTGDGGRIITVELTEDGITKAIDKQYPGFGITLTAEYTGAASAGASATNITNKMGAVITKVGSTPQSPTETIIYAPQLQIAIEKVADVTGGTAMEDVEFMLLKTNALTVNYESGTSLADYSGQQQTDIANEYVLDEDGLPVVGVTDSNGKVIFSNLPGYVDSTGVSFWLKETKTNAGYQLKTALIEVKFENKTTYVADTTKSAWFKDGNWKENASVRNTIEVINYEQGEDPDEPIFSLPLTGGAGTVIFTVAGIVLMLGAALLIIRRKKVA